jgi:Phage major capsid protein E
MAQTIEVLHWSALTTAVNEIKSPNTFLKKLVFSHHETQPTEAIEFGVFTGDREVAPFVERDGEAIPVSGYGEVFQTVTPPNIRIKRVVKPSELLFNRRPGTVIMPTSADTIVSAAEQHVARDVKRLADMVSNAEEYLCALAIRGVITYTSADEANFTITIPKPAGNNVTLTTFWDDTAGTPSADFMLAKHLVSEEVGLGVSHVVLGAEATDAFLQNDEVKALLDTKNISAGAITLMEQYRDDGAIYLGIYCGIQVWSYPRTVKLAGVATALIRTKYAEFLAVTPAAENTLYYGAIPDLEAFEGRLFQSERFSKSWTIPDPSSMQMLVHSRPLPIPRRPGSMVSMKVVSG